MGRTRLLFFFLIAFVLFMQHVTAKAPNHVKPAHRDDDDFIRKTCDTTTYKHLCERCLASYSHNLLRSPRRAAHTALSVSLTYAKSATVYVQQAASSKTKASTMTSSESGAIENCLTGMTDSVSKLRRSVLQMMQLGRPGTTGFSYHLNNVQSWASGALTDLTLCLDGFAPSDNASGSGLSSDMRSRIERLQQLTSNALALVNKINAKV